MVTGGYHKYEGAEAMKAIGVKALKAKLSEYLRLVKSGEIILITEREEVVAEIHPSRRQSLAPENLDQALSLLAEKEGATLRSELPLSWPGPTAKTIGVSSKELLDSLRKDHK